MFFHPWGTSRHPHRHQTRTRELPCLRAPVPPTPLLYPLISLKRTPPARICLLAPKRELCPCLLSLTASTSTPSSGPHPRRWWRTSSDLAPPRACIPPLRPYIRTYADTCWASEGAASRTPANTFLKRTTCLTVRVSACAAWRK